MAIVAGVTNGVLDSYTTTSTDDTTSGSDLGYDQFLQLLCAEMQYQDPLEPTTNTDYVAQMATFSQLEATLSLSDTEQSSLASGLVGKQVILKVEDSTTGKTSYVEGKVDYVMYENGDIMLSVNDKLYPIDDLDTIADDGYYEAVTLSKTFSNMVAQFPSVDNLTTSYEGALKEVRELYDGLTSYQQGFISSSDYSKLTALEEKLAQLKAAAAASSSASDSTTDDTTDGSTTDASSET